MSERAEVEVLVPLHHYPANPVERRLVSHEAFKAATDLVKPGQVLGLVSITRCEHAVTGNPAMKVRFAVEAPESIQPQRSTYAAS